VSDPSASSRSRRALLVLAALAFSRGWSSPALAQNPPQTVWRCGPEGRSYSDKPCPGGTQVEVDDPRSAAEVEEAQEIAAREKRLAEQLREERLQRERDREAPQTHAQRVAATRPRAAEPARPESESVWIVPARPRRPRRTRSSRSPQRLLAGESRR